MIKKIQDSEGVWSKLDWNDLIKVKAIHNKRVEGELKNYMKGLLVYGQKLNHIGVYSIL